MAAWMGPESVTARIDTLDLVPGGVDVGSAPLPCSAKRPA